MNELFQLPTHLIDGPRPTERPFIENVSLDDVVKGNHYRAHILIQIVDPDMVHPEPAYKGFEKRHTFSFLDVEESDDPLAPTRDHAEDIAEILKDAFLLKKSVTVHCVAGICRSGAVVEVGVMMGFQDLEKYRQPNLLLKGLLMNEVFPGWRYDD